MQVDFVDQTRLCERYPVDVVADAFLSRLARKKTSGLVRRDQVASFNLQCIGEAILQRSVSCQRL